MHKPESVKEIETHKILWVWDINRSPNPSQKASARVNEQEKNELVLKSILLFQWNANQT